MNWVMAIPNICITVSYWWIPLNGFYYWRTHREGLGNHKRLLLWYTAFIFAHGIARTFWLLDLAEFHNAFVYITAILGLRCTFQIRSFVSDLVKLPSRQELHDAIDKYAGEKALRELELAERGKLIEEQKRSIARLREMIETRMWIDDKDRALTELQDMLERMRA